jgi:hypothetical protein
MFNGKNTAENSRTSKSEAATSSVKKLVKKPFLDDCDDEKVKEDGGLGACAHMHRRSLKERVGLLANGE